MKTFNEFLNESIDDSFTVINFGDIAERYELPKELYMKIRQFLRGDMIMFSDQDEKLSLKVGQLIFNKLAKRKPSSSAIDEDNRLILFYFYRDPKAILIEEYDKNNDTIQDIIVLVEKTYIEKNWRGFLSGHDFGI